MTERTHGMPPDGMPIIPEVAEDSSESTLLPEDAALIDETISFINRTISAKALEAALLIGNYVLGNFFDDDPDAAFSQNPYKPISFNRLCEDPELNVSLADRSAS